MIINVTQKDIDEGQQMSCRYCPVAKALDRFYKNPNYVVVESTRFTVQSTHSIEEYSYPLPVHVTTWIHMFDSGYHVKPIEFEVEV
jgi:hypothetical protein